MAISNKGQLTNLYNRSDSNCKQVTKQLSKPVNNLLNSKVLDTIHKECDKPISNRWYVSAKQVYKANNYDIVDTSMSNYRKQCKYGTSNFHKIAEIEKAKDIVKSYDNFTIKQLQDMITVDNEPYILKAIEKKIDDQRKIIALHEKEAKEEKRKNLEYIAKEKCKIAMKLNCRYIPRRLADNYGRVMIG